MSKIRVASLAALLVFSFASPGYGAQGRAEVNASGDIRLGFGIQHEIDFEVRDNYDLDNGLTDGCPRAAVTGNDCSGTAVLRDGFVLQETRLIVQARQGITWFARVVLETEEEWPLDTAGLGDRGEMDLEEGWADIKLFDTPVRLRAGLWNDQLDPFRLVYAEDDTGIKVYAYHGNISWATWWIKENEVSDASAATRGRDGDQDYYLARMTLDFGSFQVSPAFGLVRNRNTVLDGRFATGHASQDAFGDAVHNFRPASNFPTALLPGLPNVCSLIAGGASCPVTADETVVYPGLIAQGGFGPVSFVGEVFGAFGEIGDDSAVDAQREQDVAAFLVALDVGVKLGAWTPHGGIIYLSGDDNPHDSDAEAWAPISVDNANFFGGRGILMDDDFGKLGMLDDSLTSEGDNPLARLYGLQPGIIALFVGLKGRPTKKISTDLWLTYFQWDMEKQWEYVDGMVSLVNCRPTTTSSERGECSNGIFTNGVADGRGLVSSVDDEVGWELSGQVTYDYNKHVKLTVSAAVFWPGDGAERVAQCANFDGSAYTLGDGADSGCSNAFLSGVDFRPPESVNPALHSGGRQVETVSSIGRADDEAVNIETELLVEF